jgi:DNA transformation protein
MITPKTDQNNRALSGLKNLGATIIKRLGEIGIYSESDLRGIGSSQAYMLMRKNSDRNLPVCYYLYSLEGALLDRHWDDIPEKTKNSLLKSIGRKGQTRRSRQSP